jgi:hypothetical protein
VPRLGGDPRVERRVLEFGVTEQYLDHPNVGVVLEQMGSKFLFGCDAASKWRLTANSIS